MKLFNPANKSMFKIMLRSEILQWVLNKTPIWFVKRRNRLLKKIVADIKGTPYLVYSPIYFQQGNNTYIGKNFFCNYDCKFLDHDEIHIGDNVMLAPGVLLTTVSHPLIAHQRTIKPFKNSFEPQGRGNIEINKPINIGNNVWIAAYSIICGGVTIGDNSIIGAGSVVTKDIPPNVLAMGTPCRVVREITDEDRISDDDFMGI